MGPPRISIAKLMVVVGVVALDITAARTLLADNREMLIGIAPAGLVLQVGIIRMMRSRGRGRVFWGGFVVFGTMAMATFVWAMLFPEVLGIRGGALIRTPGSPLHTAWYGYAKLVSERIVEPMLYDPRINLGPQRGSVLGGACIVMIRAVVWSLPQLVVALVGGVLTGMIGRRPGKFTCGDLHRPAESSPSMARS